MNSKFRWRFRNNDGIPFIEFGIEPAHKLGFTLDQCEEILSRSARIKEFERYMTGQTVASDDKLGMIIYPHDLANFLLRLPVLD